MEGERRYRGASRSGVGVVAERGVVVSVGCLIASRGRWRRGGG